MARSNQQPVRSAGHLHGRWTYENTGRTPELPEELLHAIFSKLVWDDDTGPGGGMPQTLQAEYLETLRAICLANKQYCRIAQPLLYHTLDLSEYRGSSIKSVAQKLAQFPRFANFVRRVHVDSWEIKSEQHEPVPPYGENAVPLEEPVTLHFEQALELIYPILGHHADSLLAEVKGGWEDAHLAFLLAQCRNLELLKIDIPYDFKQSHVHAVLHHFATTDKYDAQRSVEQTSSLETGLPKLTELRASHWDTENAVKIHDIEGLLCKSTLDVWTGHMINITGVDEYFAFQVQPWPFRRISLTCSLMDADGLECLLKCCSKLEHLEVEYGGALVGDECEVDFRKFSQAFCKYGQGLHTIDIDTRDWEDFSDDYVKHPLGDLTPLTQLRRLAVPRLALIGEGYADSDLEDEENFEPQVLTETLPTSLRALKIQEYGHSMDTEENEELDGKLFDVMASERFSQLKTIRIERRERFLRREGLSAIGWDDSKSNDFWVVLKRGPNVAENST